MNIIIEPTGKRSRSPGDITGMRAGIDMHFQFNDVTYTLGFGQPRQITVSGSVDSGEVLVVQGYSGSGKSTLLRILARLQPCDGGEVYLEGKNWLQIPGTAWRAGVHCLAQKPAIFDGTVAGNLAKPFETRLLSQKGLNQDLARDYMKKLLMSEELWEQDARTLSGGEAARLAFVRALLIDPKVMLLDEPAAALDEKARKALHLTLSQWLEGPSRAALLVTHNNDYEGLRRVSFLDIGKQQKGE
ncbi:MAG: putative ABC transporter ATP-binding protein YbbL [Pelotomaculum sp. PtaU1.Bin065]|nr:MAG: putative ABC transporter ATP-binding protein YbbL [Pelotomaculum sp. PtaU1.Bin065]